MRSALLAWLPLLTSLGVAFIAGLAWWTTRTGTVATVRTSDSTLLLTQQKTLVDTALALKKESDDRCDSLESDVTSLRAQVEANKDSLARLTAEHQIEVERLKAEHLADNHKREAAHLLEMQAKDAFILRLSAKVDEFERKINELTAPPKGTHGTV